MRLSMLLGLFCFFSSVAAAACGAVFIEGENVELIKPEISDATAGYWKALEDRLEAVASGSWTAAVETINAGPLPVGWYRIEFYDEQHAFKTFTTAAVLFPLVAPPPADTSIAVDVALSWVPKADPEVWRSCVQLARMAGVAMVRDRLRWRDIQPEPGPFLLDTKYEQTANLQQAHGLQLLQVFHDTPNWVWKKESDRGRIPSDLRDTWRFCRELAAHFQGRVQAWQPWNEGNAKNFGGHAVDELCSHQKAAYLGFRAGDPQVQVCWAPLGGINSEALCHGILANDAPSYFDLYAMHSYDWNHDYPKLRQFARSAASGKPLWVTECDRGMEVDPDSTLGDFTHAYERRKAEFIVQSYVSSLAAGASRHFHFILPQYLEQNNRIQFGLLRHDHTPRMGYVALAALGRLLAGARYIGQVWDETQPDVYKFAFAAQPDGVKKDVLVVWAEARVDWPERGQREEMLRLSEDLLVESVWDYLGRPLGNTPPATITGAPIFIVLPQDAAMTLPLQKPAPIPPVLITPPSPIVLQLMAPETPIQERIVNWAHESDRIMQAGEHVVAIAAYNFSESTLTGVIKISDWPDQWQCEPTSWEITLSPMERHEQSLRLHIPEPGPSPEIGNWIYVEGNFDKEIKPRLAFRIMSEQ